ncbi:MAG: GNAT family N-acetyltransferase [Ruminococcus sp.]|nr:GNAT family N-acetyltransferase [Ruminococcus sp.]
MVEIRVMTVSDYDDICEVWENHRGTNPVDDSYDGFAKYLRRNPTTSFVAEDNGKIVGTILAGHDGRRGLFHHVSVLPEYQKQGIGKMLVDNAMDALGKEGITKVLLVVFKDNDNGNAFWEHLGFTVREDLYYRNKYVK